MSAEPAVRLEGLSKTYVSGPPWKRRRVEALKPLDLEVPRGGAFGLLGLNGAGKTTTVKLMLGLLKPTTGRSSVLGGDIADRAVRRRIGYLPELPYFSRQLTAAEILRHFGSLYGLSGAGLDRKVDEVLELVRLSGAARRRVAEFSKGMQQRLGIGQALIGGPELLLCDEPMSGLDPVGIKEMRDIFLDLRRSGTTVLMNTHILDEVERLCDRVAVLHEGRLAAHVPVSEVLAARDRVPYELEIPDAGRRAWKGRTPEGARWEGEGLVTTGARLADALSDLAAAGVKPSSIRPLSSAVEAWFLETVSPGGVGKEGSA
jgi:ABC-2 type transport system ATP-binding protein